MVETMSNNIVDIMAANKRAVEVVRELATSLETQHAYLTTQLSDLDRRLRTVEKPVEGELP